MAGDQDSRPSPACMRVDGQHQPALPPSQIRAPGASGIEINCTQPLLEPTPFRRSRPHEITVKRPCVELLFRWLSIVIRFYFMPRQRGLDPPETVVDHSQIGNQAAQGMPQLEVGGPVVRIPEITALAQSRQRV